MQNITGCPVSVAQDITLNRSQENYPTAIYPYTVQTSFTRADGSEFSILHVSLAKNVNQQSKQYGSRKGKGNIQHKYFLLYNSPNSHHCW